MRVLVFWIIITLFLSCQGEQPTDKIDCQVIQENIESNKVLRKYNNDDQYQELVQKNFTTPEFPEIQNQKKQTNQKTSIYTAGKYFVISPDGLRMRAGPSLSEDVLETIPFQGEVEVLEIYNLVKDTLNKRALEKGKTIEEDFNIKNFKYNVIGDWIQVQYQEEIGYVFSAYIANGRFKASPKYSHSLQIVGRPPDGNRGHSSNIKYWYVMTEQEDGRYLEPVSIHYRTDHNLNWRNRPDYVWITPANKNGLVLGSSKKMTNQEIDIKSKGILVEYDVEQGYFPMTAKLKKKTEEEFEKLNLSLKKVENQDGIELIISDGDISQTLNSIEIFEYLWPVNISLIADIDQDGKLDYLVNYEGHKTLGVTVLFLSSEAEPGQLVKAVAFYDRGWPC